MDQVHQDAKGIFYHRECVNDNCGVAFFKWRKPGDCCPACRWL